MPIPLSGKPAAPEISVVFPLVDARGDGLEQVRSWTHLQTMPRESYQVIAVSDGSDLHAESQVARLLSPHDRLIRHNTRNFIELYDVGIRQAEGRFVVLTEHHCVARPDCLAEVETFFRQHEFDGACLNIEWVCLNEIARLKWSERNQERISFFTTPDHWNKFLFAGFAMDRAKLLQAGGLEYEYGLFLEVAAGAKFHAKGYRLGCAERAVVQHLDDNSFGKVLDFIRNYTESEIRFLANNDPEYCEQYFGYVPEWAQRHSIRPSQARAVARRLWSALWSATPSRAMGPLVVELVRQIPAAFLPTRVRLFASSLGVAAARMRFAFWLFNRSRRIRALRDACNRMVHHVRLKSILGQNQAESDSPAKPSLEDGALRFDVGRMSENQSIGCHAREVHQGESFRWTEPVATFHLDVPPGPYEVAIETRALRGGAEDYLRACFWNKHSIPFRAITVTDGVVRFTIGKEHFAAGRIQQLSVISQALVPRRQGVADDRRLGMPVFSIRLLACDHTALPGMSNHARAA